MAASVLERGIDRVPQQQIRVGVIGGLTDKKDSLNRAVQPLLAAGHDVALMDGGWFTGERTRNKIARIHNFLDGWQPEVLVGTSAGGLLAVVTGFNHPSVQRIVTAASPLRWPTFRENTLKLRAIETAVPALWGLKKEYNKLVRDNLGATSQRFLHIRGSEDEMVPPSLSWMSGAHESMRHIEHVVYQTPPRSLRGSDWAHTLNTRGVFHLPKFQSFVAGELATAA